MRHRGLLLLPVLIGAAIIPGPVAQGAPTLYEAENAVVSQGNVESNWAGFTGTGFVNYDNLVGSYVEFTVSAETGDPGKLTFRFANGTTTNRPMDVTVNGVLVADELSFPGTGAWTTWQTKTVDVTLNPGANKVRARATTANGGPNLDSVSFDVPPPPQPGAFQHPGVVVSGAQLALVKAKVAAGAQPWKKAYDTMAGSSYASLSYTAHPYTVVECGSQSNPDNGCTEERKDAIAAYTHALRWYITGDSRYAAKSIQIMDAWSAKITDHTLSNAPLQTGWAGASWSRAAEIIKHTYGGGWPNVGRFATMLRTVYLPEIVNGHALNNGNWELIMMAATTGIAVFLDDRATFDKAVNIWRGRVPAYIYLTSDGSLPMSPPGSPYDTPSEIIAFWQGQSTFVHGLSQETCRDFGHTGWGIAAANHVAETARIQGLDLYGEMAERMTKTLEFHATYELGVSVPSWLCGGDLALGIRPTLEIGYNHYANRAGVSLPKTKQLVESRRPAGDSHFLAWETLTHANNP